MTHARRLGLAAAIAACALAALPADLRPVDASRLGETTNKIIEKYGLPIPEPYPAGFGPVVTPARSR